MRAPRRFLLSFLLAFGFLAPTAMSAMAQELPDIWFPIEINDDVRWSDTYGAPRSSGRTHKGVDLMAPQMTPVYAVQSGYIARAYGGDSKECFGGTRCSSYGFLLYADDGRSYFYLHMNNDTPGRPNGCDTTGGPENAFSPRLVEILKQRGTLEPLPARWDPQDVVRVEKAELLGYTGSSGNAGCKVDHIHFESWQDHVFRSSNDPAKDNPTPQVDAAFDNDRFWGPEGPVQPVASERLAGPSRIETAIAVSAGSWESAKTAVIAPAEVYPEALVSSSLAAWVDGPVLLAKGHPSAGGDAVAPAVVTELQRLGVVNVVVVASKGNLYDGFEDALAKASGIDRDKIRRVSGNDRYELAATIAHEILRYQGWPEPAAAASKDGPTPEESGAGMLEDILGPNDEEATESPESISPILALGEHEVVARGWPDALASATLAAAQRVPVLLTRGGDLPDATREIMEHEGIAEVRIVGGTAAVSQEVEDEVKALGHVTRRLSGEDRYATALAVSEELIANGFSLARVHFATGRNFPDAMAAGAAIAKRGSLLVMVDGKATANSPAVLDWLRHNEAAIDEVVAIGGRAVITDNALRRLAVHANWAQDPHNPDDPEGQGDPDRA